MCTAIVTGAGGFIGSHLVKELCSHPQFSKVVALKRGNLTKEHVYQAGKRGGVLEYAEMFCDLRKEGEVRAILNQVRPNFIFHLAGNPNTKLGDSDPSGKEVWAANVDTTHNLLAYAPKGCRFVLASSATVYGDLAKGFGACTEILKPSPTSIYGASKVAAEGLVEAFTGLGLVRGLSLRYVATVGSGAKHGLIPDVVRKLRSDWPVLELFGDMPGSVKPYMHVSDTVNLTIKAGLNGGVGCLNLSPPDILSVAEVASVAMGVLSIYKKVQWLGNKWVWPGDNPLVSVDSKQMRQYGQPKYATSLKAVEQAVRDLL